MRKSTLRIAVGASALLTLVGVAAVVGPSLLREPFVSKFAGGDPDEEALAWLARELHIVQPKLVVVMGEDALAFLNDVAFPLAETLEPTTGELQRLTPTTDALVVPDIDASLDEQAEKTRFWNAFKLVGPWWAELPPY